MSTVKFPRTTYADEPELINMLFCCVMLKLGGQVSLTLGEIHRIIQEFPHVELALQRVDETGLELMPEFQRLTLTLRSRQFTQESL